MKMTTKSNNIKAYSVHDIQAKAYLLPFFFQHPGMAQRAFADLVNSPGHNFFKHPEDYTLFEIGEFEEINGILHPLTIPKPIGNGITFVDTQKPGPDHEEPLRDEKPSPGHASS